MWKVQFENRRRSCYVSALQIEARYRVVVPAAQFGSRFQAWFRWGRRCFFIVFFIPKKAHKWPSFWVVKQRFGLWSCSGPEALGWRGWSCWRHVANHGHGPVPAEAREAAERRGEAVAVRGHLGFFGSPEVKQKSGMEERPVDLFLRDDSKIGNTVWEMICEASLSAVWFGRF